jgi:hypothetical protein
MKTFLPPFAAFIMFGIIVVFKSLIAPFDTGDMGVGDLHSFMACFYYMGPLYFVVALLTQGLIIVPIYKAAYFGTATARLTSFLTIGVVCALAAGGVAYLIWDPASGTTKLIGLTFIMTVIQLVYWTINLFVMLLIGTKARNADMVTEESD